MRNTHVKHIALCGVMAALGVTIMCMIGLIPIATFVCPLLCMILGYMVSTICGSRLAWAWYIAVAILSLLLGPDKEGALVFLFLGYYPIIKRKIDRCKLSFVIKLLYFNLSVIVMYRFVAVLLGMGDLSAEYMEFGYVGLAVLLVLGNICFILFDFLIGRFGKNGFKER